MGGKHRAWACAGYGWFVDEGAGEPEVLAVAGERPVLCLPPGLTDAESDVAFGWAMSDLLEQQGGWLALVRHTARLMDLAA